MKLRRVCLGKARYRSRSYRRAIGWTRILPSPKVAEQPPESRYIRKRPLFKAISTRTGLIKMECLLLQRLPAPSQVVADPDREAPRQIEGCHRRLWPRSSRRRRLPSRRCLARRQSIRYRTHAMPRYGSTADYPLMTAKHPPSIRTRKRGERSLADISPQTITPIARVPIGASRSNDLERPLMTRGRV